jgi:hypothetical protein
MVPVEQLAIPPPAEDPVMSTTPAKKWFGAIVAALTLTLVASVAPASASTIDSAKIVKSQRVDSGWGPP